MNIQLRKLKIKLLHLSEEQRIIKRQTVKAKRHDRWARNQGSNQYAGTCQDLIHHRRDHVRPHLRSCFIAYGIIRGKHIEEIEHLRTPESLARKPYKAPNWAEVQRLVCKYGSTQIWTDFFNTYDFSVVPLVLQTSK